MVGVHRINKLQQRSWPVNPVCCTPSQRHSRNGGGLFLPFSRDGGGDSVGPPHYQLRNQGIRGSSEGFCKLFLPQKTKTNEIDAAGWRVPVAAGNTSVPREEVPATTTADTTGARSGTTWIS